MTFKHDHFSRVASAYADFRPRYPEALFQWLATLPADRQRAWDVGTGSGQAAIELVKYFKHVVATDLSASQLEAAIPNPSVSYRTAPAEASGLESASIDLVTVAQALHWFDLDLFYAEVNRVMRKGGVVAVWTYGIFQVDDATLNDTLTRFYHGVAGPWWPKNRTMVETGYRTISFPWQEITPPAFAMTAEWDLNQLVGYVGTWSAIILRRNQTGADGAQELLGELAPAWGDPLAKRIIRWPLSVRAGRA
jgi:ubiquinone/menaquinone biosynthesis C-methylase UbiE